MRVMCDANGNPQLLERNPRARYRATEGRLRAVFRQRIPESGTEIRASPRIGGEIYIRYNEIPW